jgi:hypothetical protein
MCRRGQGVHVLAGSGKPEVQRAAQVSFTSSKSSRFYFFLEIFIKNEYAQKRTLDFLWEIAVEKYGAIQCPKCESMNVVQEGSEKIAVEHEDLIKTASENVGGSFLCQDCKHSFNKVTGSSSGSPESESAS